jgi:DNA-binding cell septation regulator SpoVG
MTEKHAGVNTLAITSHPPAPHNRAIEVLSIEPSVVPGVVAVVGVRVGGIQINQILVRNAGRGTFCNMPSRKVDDHWIELVQITSVALRQAVIEVIMHAVREWAVTR